MVRKIVSIIIFILIMLLVIFVVSPIFVPKWDTESDNYITNIVRGFYAEKKNSLDVLFMGNSDMYRGISPIELWDDYGVASYAYTSPGQRAWTSYYVLLDALRTQKPNIIVFNVDGIQSTNQSSDSCYRKAFDNMKMSSVKMRAINDPIFDFSISEKISYFLPVIRFHSRISDLSIKDFEQAYGYKTFAYKGMDMNANVNGYEKGNSYMNDKNEIYEIPDKTQTYLDKIVETCKQNDIEIILVELPSADSWSYAKSKAFEQYSSENDVTFIDFNLILEDIDFDWTQDTADSGDHLNIYGASKVTKYIGNYLKQNYNIKDRREEEEYKDWFECSKIYHSDRNTKILNNKR